MIAFNCPKCRTVVRRQHHESGTKVPCPSCGQRLQVPQVQEPESPTIMGELVFPASSVPKVPSSAATVRCTCPHCQAVIKAPAKTAGIRAPCPRCKLLVEIPVPKAEPLANVPLETPALLPQTPPPPPVLQETRWFVHASGSEAGTKPLGPYVLEELLQFVSEGRLARQDLLCEEGTEDWVPASTVKGLGILPPAPVAPEQRRKKGSAAKPPDNVFGKVANSVARIFVGTVVSIVLGFLLLAGVTYWMSLSSPKELIIGHWQSQEADLSKRGSMVFHKDGRVDVVPPKDKLISTPVQMTYHFVDDQTIEMIFLPGQYPEAVNRSVRLQVKFPSKDEMITTWPDGTPIVCRRVTAR